MRTPSTITAVLLAMLLASATTGAATINVPGDYNTVQGAIDAAEDGDVVMVQIGTYTENLNFNGKDITLASEFINSGDEGDIAATILDGSGSSPVITLANGETAAARVVGFTIRNGMGGLWKGETYGGGIAIAWDSNPTVENCVVTGSNAEYGGGMFIYQSSPVIRNVEFTDNYATYGGGAFIWMSSPVVENCDFNNNTADFGGGFALRQVNTVLSYNLVTGNSAGCGGGIYLWGSDATLNHITIADNSAAEMGGGLCLFKASDVTLANSIAWGNSPDPIAFSDTGWRNSLTVSYSTVEGGELGITSGHGDLYWGEGNLDADPLFTTVDGVAYNLSADSPCVDAADPTDAPDPDGSPADMGALRCTLARSPAAMLAELMDEVVELVRNDEVHAPFGWLLYLPLRMAAFHYENGRERPALRHLDHFIRRLDLFARFRWIDGDLADELSAQAQAIRDAIIDESDSGNDILALDDEQVPQEVEVSRSFPNPFNSTTNLEYRLPEGGQLRVLVHDMTGRVVAELYNGYQTAGTHLVSWDAGRAPAGAYLISLQSGDFSAVRQVLLVK